MKRYIKSSYDKHSIYGWEPNFEGHWSDEDKQLWCDIDWKARNYEDFPVTDDTFVGELKVYGLPGGTKYVPATFVRYIRANPIYEPYYGPEDTRAANKKFPNGHIVGAMYDGRKHDGYMIMDRCETQDLYDALSR